MTEEIQKQGAEARARGEPMFNNPYLHSDALPAATGETVEQWSSKHANWELGWRAEDLMRTGKTEAGNVGFTALLPQ